MDKKEELIKGMFRNHAVESPGKDFTSNVMEKVTRAEELVSDHLLSPLQWVLISSGVAAAIFVIIFLDLPFLNNLFSFEGIKNIQLSGIGERLNALVESLSVSMGFSSITLMIVAAVLMLLGIDRLIKHRQNQVQVF